MLIDGSKWMKYAEIKKSTGKYRDTSVMEQSHSGNTSKEKKICYSWKNVVIYPSSVNLIEGCQHLYEGNYFSPILRGVPKMKLCCKNWIQGPEILWNKW